MNAQEFAAGMQARKEKNLRFFNRYFPQVIKSFEGYSLKNAQINLDPNTLEVNLVEHGKAIYPLEAFAYNKNEAQQFSDAFPVGGMNHPLARSKANGFYRGRYGHGSIANFLEAVEPVAEAIKPYTFRHSIPQVVFLGSGLGIHIAEFLKIRDVRHVMLLEHSSDRFFASLYVTDWEEIITPYLQDQTRTFTFSVGDTSFMEEEERVFQAFGSVWNSINSNVPFMPIQTVYYIHQADPFYSQVAERLNDEIEAFTNVWGYYDDEVNQLNHVFHNIKQGIQVLKTIDLSGYSKPTIICGNGPSLDAYLPIIKEYREKLNVVAAGSATHSLLVNDIIPDFMVTLESDYNTYKALELLPTEKAQQTPIIGAAQIAPATFGLFKDSLMYLKNETSYARQFENAHDTVANGTPSATNAALAVVLDLNPSKLFLVGMDFGFLDPSKTHSDSSFYSEADKQERFEQFKQRITAETFKVQTNERGDVYTTPFYNTARNHAERKIRSAQRQDIVNLSLGATIHGTVEQSAEEFRQWISALAVNDEPNVFELLKKQATRITEKELAKTEKNLEIGFKKLRKDVLLILEAMEPNLDSIEASLFQINQSIVNSKDPHISKINLFMRGIIWHWISNYYALCKEFDSERKLDIFTREFKRYFGGFMNYLPEHFADYVSDRTFEDAKLQLSVAEAEPNIQEWFNKISRD